MPNRDEIPMFADEIRGRVIAVVRREGPGQSSIGLEIALVVNLIDFGLRARNG